MHYCKKKELKRKRIFQILVKSGKGRSLANSFDWLNDEPNYESLLNRGFRIDDEQYYKMLSLCKVEKFEVYNFMGFKDNLVFDFHILNQFYIM